MLVRAAGNNSNLLLNIGPMPNGEIQEEFITRLHAVGEWMSRYGDSIYGTRGGPIAPADWGVTTRKGSDIYVHVLHWKGKLLALPALPSKIARSSSFPDGTVVEFKQSDDGVVLTLPEAPKSEADRVIVLSLRDD
jgi:alpha-L-fucosidase